MQDQRKRQLDAIANSFAQDTLARGPEIALQTDSTIEGLRLACQGLQSADLVYQQCGPGLLLMGLRLKRRTSFSARLLSNIEQADLKFPGLESHARGILDTAQPAEDNWNSLGIAALKPRFMLGTTPIACWPLEEEFIRQLLFQEIFIVTVYNPAFLVRRLKAAGFTVERQGEKDRFLASIPLGEGIATLHGWDHFLRFVTDHFMSEDGLMEMINRVVTLMRKENVSPNTKVLLDISLTM